MKVLALFFASCFLIGVTLAEECATCNSNPPNQALNGQCAADLPMNHLEPVTMTLKCSDLNVEISLEKKAGVEVQSLTMIGATNKCLVSADKDRISGPQDECFQKDSLQFNADRSCFALSGQVVVEHVEPHGSWSYVSSNRVDVSCCTFATDVQDVFKPPQPTEDEVAACTTFQFLVNRIDLEERFSWTVSPENSAELLEAELNYHATYDEVDWYVHTCNASTLDGTVEIPLVVDGAISSVVARDDSDKLTGARNFDQSVIVADRTGDWYEFDMPQFAIHGDPSGRVKIACDVKLCAKTSPSNVGPSLLFNDTPLLPCSLYFNGTGSVKPFEYRAVRKRLQ